MGEVFDCGKLANRSFAIEESFIDAVGYGQVWSGVVWCVGRKVKE